jgi:hypothetical protein
MNTWRYISAFSWSGAAETVISRSNSEAAAIEVEGQ